MLLISRNDASLVSPRGTRLWVFHCVFVKCWLRGVRRPLKDAHAAYESFMKDTTSLALVAQHLPYGLHKEIRVKVYICWV